MAKLTDKFIREQVPEGAKALQEFDDEQPGFGVRKFASGKASFFVKFTASASSSAARRSGRLCLARLPCLGN